MSKADASSLEIIPDSEEERAVSHTTNTQRFTAMNSPETGRRDIAGPREIIYISSDEDEDECVTGSQPLCWLTKALN